MGDTSVKQDLARALMLAQALPRVEIDMPVNMCPDDDPPGERPTEKVWATDIGAIADYLLASPAIARIRADAWDEGARWGAVEFQSPTRVLRDERQVELVSDDNPYRREPNGRETP